MAMGKSNLLLRALWRRPAYDGSRCCKARQGETMMKVLLRIQPWLRRVQLVSALVALVLLCTAGIAYHKGVKKKIVQARGHEYEVRGQLRGGLLEAAEFLANSPLSATYDGFISLTGIKSYLYELDFSARPEIRSSNLGVQSWEQHLWIEEGKSKREDYLRLTLFEQQEDAKLVFPLDCGLHQCTASDFQVEVWVQGSPVDFDKTEFLPAIPNARENLFLLSLDLPSRSFEEADDGQVEVVVHSEPIPQAVPHSLHATDVARVSEHINNMDTYFYFREKPRSVFSLPYDRRLRQIRFDPKNPPIVENSIEQVGPDTLQAKSARSKGFLAPYHWHGQDLVAPPVVAFDQIRHHSDLDMATRRATALQLLADAIRSKSYFEKDKTAKDEPLVVFGACYDCSSHGGLAEALRGVVSKRRTVQVKYLVSKQACDAHSFGDFMMNLSKIGVSVEFKSFPSTMAPDRLFGIFDSSSPEKSLASWLLVPSSGLGVVLQGETATLDKLTAFEHDWNSPETMTCTIP